MRDPRGSRRKELRKLVAELEKPHSRLLSSAEREAESEVVKLPKAKQGKKQPAEQSNRKWGTNPPQANLKTDKYNQAQVLSICME